MSKRSDCLHIVADATGADEPGDLERVTFDRIISRLMEVDEGTLLDVRNAVGEKGGFYPSTGVVQEVLRAALQSVRSEG